MPLLKACLKDLWDSQEEILVCEDPESEPGSSGAAGRGS